jgi:hypothetical protein
MKKAGTLSDYTISELAHYKRIQFVSGDRDTDGKPLRVPGIPLDHQVVARVDYGETTEAEFFECECIEDMQALHLCHQVEKSPVAIEWYSKQK